MAVLLHPVGFRMRMIQIAMRELGVSEIGNNRGERVSEYQAATSLGVGPHPWCASFLCWVYQQTCLDLGCRGLLATRPTSARAFDFEKWGESHGRTFRPVPTHIQSGDILTFDFSHVALATRGSHPVNGRAFTVEGNTDDPRSSDAPQGVHCKWRSSCLRALIRLYESTTPQL